MVTSVALYLVLLCAIYAERGVELVVSGRNANHMLKQGALEAGPAHYKVMAVFHTLFPLACAIEVVWLHRPFPKMLGWIALSFVLAAQALRWWCVAALAGRWTTRIIVPTDAKPVTSGPYRFLRHPNYLAVIIEIAALPLVHGAWATAVLASAFNGALLRVRIRAEEHALGPIWLKTFVSRPRLVPEVFRG